MDHRKDHLRYAPEHLWKQRSTVAPDPRATQNYLGQRLSAGDPHKKTMKNHHIVRLLLSDGEGGTYLLASLNRTGPYGAYSATVAILDWSRQSPGYGQTPKAAVAAALKNLLPNT